jgi:hypothetical protein
MAIDISQYTIEQNVPIPTNKPTGLRVLANTMQPGESVVVNSYSRAQSLRTHMYKSGHKATVQRINVETNPRSRDYRVWKLGEKK